MKDSTAITTRLGDARALGLFRTHNAITRKALSQYHGKEIQHTGDGFMVSFFSASNAVECAIAIQKSFVAHNQHHPAATINVRSDGNICDRNAQRINFTVRRKFCNAKP